MPSRSTSATTTWPVRFLSPLINRRTDEFGGSLGQPRKVALRHHPGGARRVDRDGTARDRGDRQTQHG